jgi:hydroxymethylbilane synthase
MTRLVRIGTRGSPLALWQANHVAERLGQTGPQCQVELVIVQTHGDREQQRSLSQFGGDGLFTKAIQDAVLAGRCDVAVHSLKDLPTAPVAGLVLAAVPPRGPAGDVFVSGKYSQFGDLPTGARVGTGSLRRRAQILHRRPDLQPIDIRGNIETRLKKLAEMRLDALILAEAGLIRLNLGHRVTERLDAHWMLPAVGQGALGIECRAEDKDTRDLLARIEDLPSRVAVTAERSLLSALGGGCQIPLGALGSVVGRQLNLRAALLSADGATRIAGEHVGPLEGAELLGKQLAESLFSCGARGLLDRVGPSPGAAEKGLK